MPTRFTVAAFLIALLAVAASPARPQTLSLSAAEGRRLAQSAALDGQPELARRIAAGVLTLDRQDRTALIVLAAVEPQLGRPAQGRMAGARAFRVSQTPAQRYEAARLTAAAAAREGRYTLAQFWLRRAAVNAPAAADLAQTGRDFARIRARNPWNIQLRLDAAPSSNVNGGSSSTVNVIDGLPFVGELSGDAQALSGWTASADVQVSYRMDASRESRTVLSYRLYGRAVALSGEARETAPDAENSDFSAAYTAVSLRHDRALADGAWGTDATLGGNWYGGAPAYGFLRLGLDRQWLDDGRGWQLGGSAEHRALPEGRPGTRIFRLSGSHFRGLDSGRLSLSAGLEKAVSEQRNERAEAVRLSAGYSLARQTGPARLSFTAGIETRHFPDYVAPLPVPGGREDLRTWGSVSAAFTDWDWAGFAPVVNLSGSSTQSNVSRFERSELSLGLTFRSTF